MGEGFEIYAGLRLRPMFTNGGEGEGAEEGSRPSGRQGPTSTHCTQRHVRGNGIYRRRGGSDGANKDVTTDGRSCLRRDSWSSWR